MKKLINWIKDILKHLYSKPLVSISFLKDHIDEMDKNKDSMISLNEVWEHLVEQVRKVKGK